MGQKEWREISEKRYYKTMALLSSTGVQVDSKGIEELDAMTQALRYIEQEEVNLQKELQQWKECATALHEVVIDKWTKDIRDVADDVARVNDMYQKLNQQKEV